MNIAFHVRPIVALPRKDLSSGKTNFITYKAPIFFETILTLEMI